RHVAITAEPERLSVRASTELARQASTILGLGLDGPSRMLRAPTVFEDLTKLILTSNCTWSATERMNEAVVELGEPAAGGRRAFPAPAVVAAAGEQYLTDVARAGARSGPL